MADLALGIDLGSSGVRIAALDANGHRVAFAALPMPVPRSEAGMIVQDPAVWWNTTCAALEALRPQIDFDRLGALSVDATSGTILGVDRAGRPVTPALMYSSADLTDIVVDIAAVAPPETAARAPTSALARAIAIQHAAGVVRVLHQADWISGQFSGRFDVTDENNALKTGYDPVARHWPCWIGRVGMLTKRLPSVVPPGTVTEKISRSRAAELGLPAELAIVAGTTDGCAAFLATGATKVGEAVTSLGTTLILKLLSKRPLFAPEFGVYSHRIDDVWLTGGASNSGGAAIERHFTLEQIKALSKDISPNVPTSLDYYPLPGRGERFPLNQPDLDPQLEPRPSDDVVFLQALMEGIAGIEKRGYVLLNQLGGPALASVRTVGGGAKSRAWSEIRSRVLGVPSIVAEHDQPAVGSAKLAWRALRLPSDDLATR